MADEPLRTTTFTLTRADALAYEQAAMRLTPLGVLVLLLWLGLFGAGALFIPPGWAGPRLGWASTALVSVLIAIGAVLALLAVSVRQWLAARKRLRRTIEVTVTEWPDRLEIVGGGLPRELPLAEIRHSRLTRTHLFLATDEGVLILPRSAFPEEGAIEDLAARVAEPPPASVAVDPPAPKA